MKCLVVIAVVVAVASAGWNSGGYRGASTNKDKYSSDYDASAEDSYRSDVYDAKLKKRGGNDKYGVSSGSAKSGYGKNAAYDDDDRDADVSGYTSKKGKYGSGRKGYSDDKASRSGNSGYYGYRNSDQGYSNQGLYGQRQGLWPQNEGNGYGGNDQVLAAIIRQNPEYAAYMANLASDANPDIAEKLAYYYEHLRPVYLVRSPRSYNNAKYRNAAKEDYDELDEDALTSSYRVKGRTAKNNKNIYGRADGYDSEEAEAVRGKYGASSAYKRKGISSSWRNKGKQYAKNVGYDDLEDAGVTRGQSGVSSSLKAKRRSSKKYSESASYESGEEGLKGRSGSSSNKQYSESYESGEAGLLEGKYGGSSAYKGKEESRRNKQYAAIEGYDSLEAGVNEGKGRGANNEKQYAGVKDYDDLEAGVKDGASASSSLSQGYDDDEETTPERKKLSRSGLFSGNVPSRKVPCNYATDCIDPCTSCISAKSYCYERYCLCLI